ncbi:hypothetical protein [Pseudomonas sp. WS 5079]|uniref:hypothetical protein n=1 Tax=Pseudomonas sp. WS 5079 TaxID=2717492 RepID=UPI0015540C8E|nr:hypothetical protein [Pseudomonas sp. WS 5079]NMX60233.1 hypothetical protein [Pseudomonas sp. WS 5079]
MGMTHSELVDAVDLGKFIDWVHALKEERDELRNLLATPKSCGACGGCTNGCSLDQESPPTDLLSGLLQAAAYHDAIVKSWEAERDAAQEAINEYGLSQPGQREWDRLNLASASAANHFDFANDMRRMAAGEKPLNCPLWVPVIYVERCQVAPVSLDEAFRLFEATACKQSYDMRGGVRAVMELCLGSIGRKLKPVTVVLPERDPPGSSLGEFGAGWNAAIDAVERLNHINAYSPVGGAQ